MQAARLLLPGVDCPVRALGEEAIRVRRINGNEDDHLIASRQIQVVYFIKCLEFNCIIQHITG